MSKCKLLKHILETWYIFGVIHQSLFPVSLSYNVITLVTCEFSRNSKAVRYIETRKIIISFSLIDY